MKLLWLPVNGPTQASYWYQYLPAGSFMTGLVICPFELPSAKTLRERKDKVRTSIMNYGMKLYK